MEQVEKLEGCSSVARVGLWCSITAISKCMRQRAHEMELLQQ
jgi:hypothetical protein